MELLIEKGFLNYYNQDLFAKTAIETINNVAESNNKETRFENIFSTKENLLNKKEYNPVLKNAIAFFMYKLQTDKIKQRSRETIKTINKMHAKAVRTGANKIKDNSKLFVFSITNQLADVLSYAKKEKTFTINTSEHNPFGFGICLKNKHNSVNLYHDIELKDAMHNSSICFFGADAVLNNGTIAKTGCDLVTDVAYDNHVPVFVCAHSWKYDRKAMQKEILEHRNDNMNHRKIYGFIPNEKIYGYITEHGIIKPNHIEDEIRLHNHWMFI